MNIAHIDELELIPVGGQPWSEFRIHQKSAD